MDEIQRGEIWWDDLPNLAAPSLAIGEDIGDRCW
jgi:hypothetical protein